MIEGGDSKPDDVAGHATAATPSDPADDATVETRMPSAPPVPPRPAPPVDPEGTTDYPVMTQWNQTTTEPWHQPVRVEDGPVHQWGTPPPLPGPAFPPPAPGQRSTPYQATMSGFPAPRRQRVPADRRTMGIAGAGLLGLLLLVGGFWWPGFFHRTTLDVHAAEKGVQTVLSDPNGYGATDVSNVKCNNGSNPVVKSGRSFGCEVEINGAQHHVTVTFADNSGTYWVGAPS